ncbi:Putative disease resistance protein RGA4 [Dendrobium catenatum]|uniref:Disease resistance protein RGA4 n=1 Tax=Dendrobium catenatum TaxID=906689 RepID=A0A2I0XAD9_9ASPA|nr:Putative disease resistance protein RGA4 [Dendrobium catenatum]
MEPLRSIASLKTLTIWANDEVVSFPNEVEQWFLTVRSSLSDLRIYSFKSLQSLPSTFESLSSLQYLCIWDVPMLRELPNLPPSLECLEIKRCHPELKERYGEDGGSDRHKIAHISKLLSSQHVPVYMYSILFIYHFIVFLYTSTNTSTHDTCD